MKKLIIITTIIASIVIFGAVGLANLAGRIHETNTKTANVNRSSFDQVNSKITAYHGNKGFGNNSISSNLANAFSDKITVIRNEMFSKGKENSLSLTSGNFITYCHVNDDTIIYLCHVPQLRKFDSEAKEAINKYAFQLAKGMTAEEIKDFKGKVIVGLRGAIIYDKFMIGNMGNEFVQELSSIDGKKLVEIALAKKAVNAQQGDTPEPASPAR